MDDNPVSQPLSENTSVCHLRALVRHGDKPSTWIRKRFGVYRVKAIAPSAALVSMGTPVSFVARLPALAPPVPFNLCTMIGTSGLTAKRLHGWPFTCRPRPCESTSALHLLLRPDPSSRLVLCDIPLCCGWQPTIRARVPNWICGGHAHYLQL